jgi:hypothetical protein
MRGIHMCGKMFENKLEKTNFSRERFKVYKSFKSHATREKNARSLIKALALVFTARASRER